MRPSPIPGWLGVGIFPGGANVLQSYWFVKSDHLGKVSVGQQSSAGDNAAILVDGSGSLVPANWVMFDNANFFIRSKNWHSHRLQRGAASASASLSAENIGGDCEAVPTNVVRYDSPVFAGFSVSADWGQNDGYWDAYARYAGEWNGIKIAATSGWSQANTAEVLQSSPIIGGSQIGNPQSWRIRLVDCRLTPLHALDGQSTPATLATGSPASTSSMWQPACSRTVPMVVSSSVTSRRASTTSPTIGIVKAGLRERWTSLGHTVLYGFYAQRNDMFDNGVVGGATGLLVDPHGTPQRISPVLTASSPAAESSEWGARLRAGNRCSGHVRVGPV